MNYLKIYIALCRRGMQERNLEKIDIENHHVFPESIYGKNSFTSQLTTREHLVAHMCLVRFFNKRYGILDLKTRKMSMAVHKMVYRLSKKINARITSRHYEFARKAARLAKLGRPRPDMVGKYFFGASEERIQNGIEKTRRKKLGVKIDYPKNRKSRIQSLDINTKISKTRLLTLEKYKNMTASEFVSWVSKQALYMSDGRKNGNITRAIIARGEDVRNYYA